MNGVAHIKWHAPLAVSGCDDWGFFWRGPRALLLNRRNGPLSLCKGHQAAVWSQALTHKNNQLWALGEVAVLFLLQHGPNQNQIWPTKRSAPHSFRLDQVVIPALTTWMGSQRGPRCSCHQRQMSLMPMCCHVGSDGRGCHVMGLPQAYKETDKWED